MESKPEAIITRLVFPARSIAASLFLVLPLTAVESGVAVPGAAAVPADSGTTLLERLRLEAHGFVSFGYLRTWENNWLGDDTIDGTGEFYEAALNAIARPANRLRIGAQLFTRDLVSYDNGRVEVDWAYADYRVADELGISLGRVKVPFGLYNETLDVDSARTPIFLPQFYPLRARDRQLSVDGGKVYGLVGIGDLGSLEYAVYGGDKHYADESSTVQQLGEFGFGEDPDVDTDWIAGGVVEWNTPLTGLALRLSLWCYEDFVISGVRPGGATADSETDSTFSVVSAVYERSAVTVACEWAHLRNSGEAVFTPPGLTVSLDDELDSVYLALTWHAKPWLDLYLAGDITEARREFFGDQHGYRAVAAVAVRPAEHLTLKLEAQHNDGTLGIAAADNPQGVAQHWQAVALKATVDF